MKYLHIVGNRPQFVKLLPFLEATKSFPSITNVIVHSGQHYDYEMSKVFFDELDLPPVDFNLEVGSASGNVQTAKILEKLDSVLTSEKPDLVVVYGDTNTTLAGALAAYKKHIPLAHVEAGMREYLWRPEEINKKVADHCSDFCFCPMERAFKALKNEGISDEVAFFSGDITYDAFRMNMAKARMPNSLPEDLRVKPYVLMTMHRAETVDCKERISSIVDAILKIRERIVFPVHPHTAHSLEKFGLFQKLRDSQNLLLIKPVGYLEFLGLLQSASAVITDSGGVIKEAYYARKRAITIDQSTEYNEIFDLGWNKLVGFEEDHILSSYHEIMEAKHPPKFDPSLFGDGNSAFRMVERIQAKMVGKI